jgi:hypothetical protein
VISTGEALLETGGVEETALDGLATLLLIFVAMQRDCGW